MREEHLISSKSTALQATIMANNVITYTAKERLEETSDIDSKGLHVNSFNVKIESHTFSNGTGTITFAGEITAIGHKGFYGCEDLTSIVIPDSVTIIRRNAFEGCKSLTSVAIPNSVKVIGYRAFAGCESLTEIIIPNSITIIEEEAFLLCSGLKSIVIPNVVSKIRSGVFERCESLESITCHATTPPILEEFCFGGVLLSIPVYVPDEAVNAYKKADGWKDFKNILSI